MVLNTLPGFKYFEWFHTRAPVINQPKHQLHFYSRIIHLWENA